VLESSCTTGSLEKNTLHFRHAVNMSLYAQLRHPCLGWPETECILFSTLHRSLSDLTLFYCGKAGTRHFSRSISLNRATIRLNRLQKLTNSCFPSLRTVKSDRLLVCLIHCGSPRGVFLYSRKNCCF
jgi:hypothetical protein